MQYKHVIGHYYPNRLANLEEIVAGLNVTGTEPLIWNNSGKYLKERSALGEYDVVDSPNNPVHGRYLAALIYPEYDIFLFQDDDLMIGPDTINRLVQAAAATPGMFCGIEGRRLDWNSKTPYLHAQASRLPETETDMVIRCYACHRSALTHGLTWILRTGIHPGRSETILFSGGISRLVPETEWTNLPEQGVGLSHEANHDSEIDEFIRKHGIRF